MAHHKRRHRKPFKGCCGMCACRDHDMGVRNKRALTPQELRAARVDEFDTDAGLRRYDEWSATEDATVL